MKPKSKITIRVTKRDIELGMPMSDFHNPVAISACRVFKKPMFANPSRLWSAINGNNKCDFIPEEVGLKMIRYDQGKGMKPFSFTVRV